MDKETLDLCLTIAKGCHDYNGGYSDKDWEIYHHGIQTVVNCLEALSEKQELDFQLQAVYNHGKSNSHV